MGVRRWFAVMASGAVLAAIFASGALAAKPAQQSPPLIQVSQIQGVGVLTNSQGLTLYFLSSEAGGKVQCVLSCLTAWPPLLLPAGTTAPTAGAGVTGTLGTVTRSDGTVQATYNGYPLYTFLGDKKPGDTTGDSIVSFGGTWHIATATGAAPTGTATPPASTPMVLLANNALGGILTTNNGLTLYYNTAENASTFVCTGACETAWPPLVLLPGATAPTAGPGITGKLSTTKRPDGSLQVTYNGEPLYNFVRDAGPGDTKGNGLKAFGGTWFAALVNNTPLAATPAVGLTLRISSSQSTVWGQVTVRYTSGGHQVAQSCAAASCALVLPPGVTARLTQHPFNAKARPFSEWRVTNAFGGPARIVRSSSLTLKPTIATTVRAVYTRA